VSPPHPVTPSSPPRRWDDLAARVLDGHCLSAEEGLAVLKAADDELLDLLAAAYRVRRRWFGNRVHLNFLINAKSGQCGEDCAYCSQSRVSRAEIARYELLGPQQVLDGARQAAEGRAGTYCIVTSGLKPGRREMELITAVVPQIKKALGLRVCVSPGLLGPEEAAQLRACGVDRVNHNLNTSRRFYPRICTSHTYEERLSTLLAIRQAGLEICSGGVVGMGEEPADVVELALRLAELRVEAIPINFFIPIPGIPLAESRESRVESREPDSAISALGSPLSTLDSLNPRYCLKVLALFRLANPKVELRIAGGRELHLGSLQPLGLYAANSIFVGDYLTTKGQTPEADYKMIEELGFEITREETPLAYAEHCH
jgi:biotin synthase